MKFKIVITASAKADMREILRYVADNDSPENAGKLLDGIERTVALLADMPERGHNPPELARMGLQDFREVHYKPFRIIYAIAAKSVIVHAVLDGRRDMQTLLQQRLLR